MAKKSLMVKTARRQNNAQKARKAGKKVEFCTRVYNRCHLCGRSRGYIRKFQICRICFRFLAAKGLIPGLTKSSW